MKNSYDELISAWKVKLINRRAVRMGFRSHELDDLQQQIVPHVAAFQFDSAKSNGANERTALIAVIDRQLKALVRLQARYRGRIEQFWRAQGGRDGTSTDVPRAAMHRDKTDLILDVQQAVARLSPREQVVCRAIGEGRSLHEVAAQLGCCWHTVRRHVIRIRREFQALGLDGWVRE